MVRLKYDNAIMENKIAQCGTRSGYNRHIRLKEKTCDLCKKANREWVSNWTLNNPERIKEINKKARIKYRSRPEIQQIRIIKGREYIKTEKGKESGARSNHKRRARKLNCGTEKYTTKQILELYGAVCHICKEIIDLTLPRKTGQPNWEMGLHLDHKIPLAKGGSDTVSNIRPSHGICNKRKGGK
jgi:5-methylcytosine-specific restriction endonuclease McrA